MKYLFIIISLFCVSTITDAQNDAGLKKISGIVEGLRSAKITKTSYTSAINTMAEGHEKITLLDDIGTDKQAEYHGKGCDKFHLNGVVTKAYCAQSGANMSKGNFNDSRQRGIFYSLIEKTVKAGKSADFTVKEHCGNQEFVILPYNNYNGCSVTITCIGRDVQSYGNKDKYLFSVNAVTKQDVIHIRVTNKSKQPVSFAILNYNPQKSQK